MGWVGRKGGHYTGSTGPPSVTMVTVQDLPKAPEEDKPTMFSAFGERMKQLWDHTVGNRWPHTLHQSDVIIPTLLSPLSPPINTTPPVRHLYTLSVTTSTDLTITSQVLAFLYERKVLYIHSHQDNNWGRTPLKSSGENLMFKCL